MPAYMIIVLIASALYSLLLIGGYTILTGRMKRMEGAIGNLQALPAGQTGSGGPGGPRDERSVAVKVSYFPDPEKTTEGLEFLFIIVKSYSVSSERRDADGIEKLDQGIKNFLCMFHNLLDYHLDCRIWHKDSPMEAVKSLKDRLRDSHIQVVSIEEL